MSHAVAVYARKSNKDDASVSVNRQEKLCTEYAADAFPGTPVRAYADNAVSGATTEREAYQALLADVRAGQINEIVVFEQSRLTRDPAAWEDLMVVLDRAGIHDIHQVKGSPVSIRQGDRLVGRILSAVDAEERERAIQRTRAAHRTLAREGRPSGGRPYGFDATRVDGRAALVINDAEAQVLRTIVDRLESDNSLATIAADLNTAGTNPRRAARWSPSAVKSVVLKPTVAGLRVDRQGEQETLVTATWPAIIEPDRWKTLTARFSGERWVTDVNGDRRRVVTSVPKRSSRLLTGLLFCAECGEALKAGSQSRRGGKRVRAYQCHPAGHVSVMSELVDEYVVEGVFDALDSPAMVAALSRGDTSGSGLAELAGELAEVDALLEDAGRRIGEGKLDLRAGNALIEAATSRRAKLERAITEQQPTVSVELAGVRDRWSDLTVTEQRQVVSFVVGSVVVRRGRSPIDERLTISFAA